MLIALKTSLTKGVDLKLAFGRLFPCNIHRWNPSTGQTKKRQIWQTAQWQFPAPQHQSLAIKATCSTQRHLFLLCICLFLPPNTSTRGDIRQEYDEMVIRGDINYSNNGQTKGSVGEDSHTWIWSSGRSAFFSHLVVSLTCKCCYLPLIDALCSCSKGDGDLAWPFVKQIRQISVVFVHYHNNKLHFASGTGEIQITRNTTQFPSCYPPKSWKGKHYDKLFMLCYLTFFLVLFKLVPCFSCYLSHFIIC